MKSSFAFLGTLFFSFLIVSHAQAAKVIINIQNIANDEGQIKVTLCDEATFLTHNCPYKQREKSKPGEMVITYENIPAGTWGVLAYHDANNNDDLDRNFLGMPTEQFGFSNNPGYNHKPGFNESQFVIGDQDVTLNIKLSDN